MIYLLKKPRLIAFKDIVIEEVDEDLVTRNQPLNAALSSLMAD